MNSLLPTPFLFLTFFQGDERGGRPYETWTGSLGTIAESFPPQAIATEPQRNVQPAVRAPHFQLSPSAIFSQR